MKTRVYQCILLLLLLLNLHGCGAGAPVGSESMNDVAGGGIGGTGITSVGTITALGKSITVNGIEYEIDNSQIIIGKKDQGKNISGLKTGMVVTVKGKVNSDGKTGKADVVNFDADVEGSITSIDFSLSTFIVLGQTVVVNNKTIFEINNLIVTGLSGLSGFTVSDNVEISGLVGLNGNILATHVEKKVVIKESEVKGLVKNINSVSKTFNINNLLIDYSKIVLGGLTISNGDVVKAKGTIDIVKGVFNATSVEKEKSVEVENNNGSEFKLSGYVSSVDKNQLILLTATGTTTIQMKDTKFEGGTIENLQVGVKIEVEGKRIEGLLTARKISFSDDHKEVELVVNEIRGRLEEAPSDTTTLKVSGIVVDTSQANFYNTNDAKIERQIFFSKLSIGTLVEVKGNMTGFNKLKATKVSLKKSDDDDDEDERRR